MSYKLEVSEDEKLVIGATAILAKNLIMHSIGIQLKDAPASDYAVFLIHVFLNAIGNGLRELCDDESFINNCRSFTKDWEEWIKNAEKALAERKKEAY